MRKVACFLAMASVMTISAAKAAQPGPHKIKGSGGLISRGYGIVTAEDLAQDAKARTTGRYWQCVPIPAVKRDYNEFMDEDPMGPSGVETRMCDLEVIIDLPTGRHVYGDRRRHPNSFCQEFEQNWRRLTQGEKIVCFSGDDPSSENDAIFGKYRAWVWNKFKTRRGCYSYFDDCRAVR